MFDWLFRNFTEDEKALCRQIADAQHEPMLADLDDVEDDNLDKSDCDDVEMFFE